MKSDVFSNMRLIPIKNSTNNLRAYGDVIVSGSVKVKFTVYTGKNGIFAKFPARKGSKQDENGKDIWYPDVSIPSKELYQEFQSMVVTEYTNVTTSDQGTSNQSEQSQTEVNDGIPF